MKKLLFISLLVLAYSGICFGQIEDKPAGVIKVSSIPFPLTWESQPKAFETSKNRIFIEADKETDLFTFVDGNYYINNAPKLLFSPDTNFVFKTKVKPYFQNTYDGGAILIYSDEKNWANLLFEKNERGQWFIVSSVVKNKHSDGSYHAVIDKNEVYLKVAKSGNVFCFYHSTDGKNWVLTRTFPYENLKNMRIGFYSQSAKGSGCKVEFSDIFYKGVGFSDFFSGE